MARWFYTAFFYLISPLVLLRLLYRGGKAPAYRQRVLERFGYFSVPETLRGKETLWVHSVSVGETIAAAPLIKQLLLRYPDYPLVVTTMTPTGSERVKALFGDQVFHVYAPYDLPGSVKRFLERLQPKMLIIMETELWPNTIHFTRRQGACVLLANARLSEKSAAGYRRLQALARSMLQEINLVAAQHQSDAERFLALGLPEQNLLVTGSIKFDLELSETLREQATALRVLWNDQGARPVWVAASTHDGEDEIVIAAHQQLLITHPRLLLILVPRHPERFDSVAALCEQQQINLVRRSSSQPVSADTQLLLGDTMGELLLFFGCSDIAFVGGSLVERGGHNYLEPAAWGLPLLSGVSDFNFLAISEQLQKAGALTKVADVNSLKSALDELLLDKDLIDRVGQQALAVVEENKGSLQRLLAAIGSFMTK